MGQGGHSGGHQSEGSQSVGHSSMPQFPECGVCSVGLRGLSWCPVKLAQAGIHQEIHSPAGEGTSRLSEGSLGQWMGCGMAGTALNVPETAVPPKPGLAQPLC